MKRLILLILILTVAAVMASATPLPPCSTVATLDVLITGGGCTSGQGLTFTGFSLTNAGSLAASDITVTLLSSPLGGGQFYDNWTFNKTSGFFTSGFELTYTVSVTTANAQGVVEIIQSANQIDSHVPNSITAVDKETVGAVGTTPFVILPVDGLHTGDETNQSQFYSLVSFTTDTVISDPSGAPLTDYKQAFTSSVPEPVTFLLIGSGLIGLTFLRRRIRKS